MKLLFLSVINIICINTVEKINGIFIDIGLLFINSVGKDVWKLWNNLWLQNKYNIYVATNRIVDFNLCSRTTRLTEKAYVDVTKICSDDSIAKRSCQQVGVISALLPQFSTEVQWCGNPSIVKSRCEPHGKVMTQAIHPLLSTMGE